MPLYFLSLCKCTQKIEFMPSKKHQSVETIALQDHLPKSTGRIASPLKSEPSSIVAGGRSLGFISMRGTLERFSILSAEKQNLNLQSAQWHAFKFSPSSLISPQRHTLNPYEYMSQICRQAKIEQDALPAAATQQGKSHVRSNRLAA